MWVLCAGSAPEGSLRRDRMRVTPDREAGGCGQSLDRGTPLPPPSRYCSNSGTELSLDQEKRSRMRGRGGGGGGQGPLTPLDWGHCPGREHAGKGGVEYAGFEVL